MFENDLQEILKHVSRCAYQKFVGMVISVWTYFGAICKTLEKYKQNVLPIKITLIYLKKNS